MKKTILINSAIFPDGWGDTVSLNQVIKMMGDAKKGDDIEVLINSPGGSVWEGTSIFNYLRAYEPTVRIIGMAGSIASVIALAGKKIIMDPGSMFMVHNPSKVSVGNEHDHRLSADQLASVKKSMIEAYQTRINKSEEELIEWLDTERFISGKEAKELGLADEYNSKPREGGKVSMTDSTYSFVALMNTEKPTTENNNIITNQGDPIMDFEAKFNALQETLTSKESEITSIKEQVATLQATNTQLTEDLKQANLTALNTKREAITAEEQVFVSKLIEDHKVDESRKDLLVKDLVAKRLSEDETMYNEQREFLASLSPNPLTQPQATGDRVSGSASTPSIDASDFNNPEKQTKILKAVEALAKENNISFEEAYNQYLDSAQGGN